MRILLLVGVLSCLWLTPALADDTSRKPNARICNEPSEASVVYEELQVAALANKIQRAPDAKVLAGLKGEARELAVARERQRASSARMELDYWYQHKDWFSSSIRKAVKTKDGKAAEVLLLNAPGDEYAGNDFSLAFLMVDNRVVDWASCWTYNRTASQELLLEDVDGDGALDLAFRATEGFWGLQDERKQTRPGDKRTWLYAYTITSEGFQRIFPDKRRDLCVKLNCDSGECPISLQLKGLPESLREYQMYECTISATNTGKHDLAIKPGEWFALDFHKAGAFRWYQQSDKRDVLKPGETISQTIRVYLEGKEEEVTIRLKFVPSVPPVGSP